MDQVDNFSIYDGEVDQPVYEGPQTRSHTRKLAKANLLMNNLFDIESGNICDDITDIFVLEEKHSESIRDPILNFWYKQLFTIYCVYCDLAEAGTCSINC